MKFVTKKEFESAIEILERAIKNNQLGIIDSSVEWVTPLTSLGLFDAFHTEYQSNRVTFIAPDLAAKEQLHRVRQLLKTERQSIGQKNSLIESLEQQEKKLANDLALLKV